MLIKDIIDAHKQAKSDVLKYELCGRAIQSHTCNQFCSTCAFCVDREDWVKNYMIKTPKK